MAGELPQRYERYSHGAQAFVAFDELNVVTFLNYNDEGPLPAGEVLFDMGLYDIPETVVSALHSLNKRYPRCLARVGGPAGHLSKVVQANDTGIRLVAEASLPHLGLTTPSEFLPRVLAAGCVGAVVDEMSRDLASEYPEAIFLRRVTT